MKKQHDCHSKREKINSSAAPVGIPEPRATHFFRWLWVASATARRLRLKGGKDGGATAPGEGQAARQAVPSLAHLVMPLAPVRFPPKSDLGGDRPACRPSTSPLTGGRSTSLSGHRQARVGVHRKLIGLAKATICCLRICQNDFIF